MTGRLRTAVCVLVAACTLIPAAHSAAYTFVSAPDAWNADVGTVRTAPGWESGEPDSTNADWQRAVDTLLDRFASHSPAFVLTAGDAVNGHWYMDTWPYDTLGALRRLPDTRAAVRAAARIYYPQWKAGFTRRGLVVDPAVGDHEIGDNPWQTARRQALVATYRRAWAATFTRAGHDYRYPWHPRAGTQHASTAYAFELPPALFVTLDVFNQRPDGSVHLEVVGEQLRWLRTVLRAANRNPAIRFIVVQGHAPVERPGLGFHSSQLMVEGGITSPFWRTLVAEHVDLYLSGEFHIIGDANAGGVEEIMHGSILGAGAYNYLAADVRPTRLTIRIYRALVSVANRRRMWQIGDRWPLAHPLVTGFELAGSMVITAQGRELRRTGCLRAVP